ncbi:PIKK family atypical protein kinase [Tritrichomonas foetus]|uniref:PIKK family atypical protein kinase n=1 Tax=Tritrichomonas foetus TaxID=1144522 RepID=A0A1J4KI92_9EUKA|nr:PIKK family atypical protein kinase [Tritrichomonas foetus]|eukprot:OHT09053.1 PIKK family atypical protein kinase [Tritrichomonas foetus]
MKNTACLNIAKLFESDEVSDYKSWKKHRKALVSNLGPNLLSFNEVELTALFSSWESEIKDKSVSESIENYMSCMLIISLLCFFRRSFDQVKKFYPVIVLFIGSENRNICRIAIHMLHDLMTESSDNAVFLRETLEIAKQSFHSNNRNQSLFNSLIMLKVIGRFLPNDVFGITLSHLPEIWKATSSFDEEICEIALKVIDIHIQHVPAHTAESFATSLYIDCMNELYSVKSAHEYYGVIEICLSLYKKYPHVIKIRPLIDCLNKILLTRNQKVVIVIYRFLIYVAEKKEKEFSDDLMSHSIIFLISLVIDEAKLFTSTHDDSNFGQNFQIYSKNRLKPTINLLKLLKKLITTVPTEVIPVESIVEMVHFLSVMQKSDPILINNVFGVLATLLLIMPTFNFPLQLFSSSWPSKNYVKSIILTNYPIRNIKSKLQSFCENSCTFDSPLYDQKTALLIIKYFSSILFDDSVFLLEIIQIFSFSPNIKIRCLYAKALAAIDTPLAHSELLKLAAYDNSKYVRICSLKVLKAPLSSSLITSLLTDKSFKVRQTVIPLVAETAHIDPIGTISSIILFVNGFIASNLLSQGPYWCAKTCSLLPSIAQYFAPFSQTLISPLAYICVTFLLHGDRFPESTIDLQAAIHRDFIDSKFDQELYSSTNNGIHLNKSRIYQIENEKWIEKRDEFLFKTLGFLSQYILPYTSQIFPVFIKAFKMYHNENVYLAALESLTKIVMSYESKLNIMQMFPDLLPSLMHLIGNNCSNKVAIAILKLTGTMGATSSVIKCIENDDNAVKHLFTIKNPSYFTTFVLSNLTKMLSSDTSPCIFDAITNTFIQETSFSLPFLQPILQGFIKAIELENNPTKLFNQLEHIIMKSQLHIVPYLNILTPFLKKYIANINGVRISIVMSYNLNTEFVSTSAQLYQSVLLYIDTPKFDFFKAIIKFITFIIIFQHQSVDLYLNTIEDKMFSFNMQKEGLVLKSLSQLVQTNSVSLYTSRIGQLCFNLMKNGPKCPDFLSQLILNLLSYNDLSLYAVEQQCLYHRFLIEHFEEIKLLERRSDITRFIRKIPIELIPVQLSPHSTLRGNPFQNVSQPIFNNARQWIEDLTYRVVSNSPSLSIQSCLGIIEQSQTFRQDIFPIAFFSCWKLATFDDKKEFSIIIQNILEKFETQEPELIHLADFLDRCGHPLLISDDILAASSDVTSFTLFYLQRHLIENQSNTKTIASLLELNFRMGRIESARGLLSSVNSIIDAKFAGKWSEQLGEWEKALEIYEAHELSCDNPVENANFGNLLRCYAHLELWDKVRIRYNAFNSFDQKWKMENAIWYAWAFYHSNEFDKVRFFIRFFIDSNDFNSILFLSLFSIASDEYNKTEKYIQRGFDELTNDLNVFSGSNANKASNNMVFAQHLIELTEVLNMKKTGDKNIPKMWQHRLQNFSHESNAWTKLIEIRSLVLSPEDHMETYLKMLSILRKARKWRLIDAYCDRFFNDQSTIALLISRLKILWARGSKFQAASLLEKMNKLLMAVSYDEIHAILFTIKPNERTFLMNSIPSDTEKINEHERARLLRIQANWQYQLHKKNFSALTEICNVFENSIALISDDFRTWAGWAYTSSAALNALSNSEEEGNENGCKLLSQYSIKAITGFLKAAQLKESDSLEYLCQMFSIFFRYGEDFNIPNLLLEEIILLPPTVIIQIIPQIVVHIAHKGNGVKQIVREIIENFGDEHFQAVIYPLNVLSQVNGSEKAEVAKELMQKLGRKQGHIFSEIKLFIDGMHRSAVSLIEQCISALDSSSYAFRRNDKELIGKIISTMLDVIDSPKCEMDKEFQQTFKSSIQRIKSVFEKFKKGDTTYTRQLWDSLRIFFSELEDKLKKIDSFQLSKISEELAEKNDFDIVIPGTYNVMYNSPELLSIDPLLTVIPTQQHPRTITMKDKNSKSWKFLLKGNEDLRLDQRIMQLFTLINSLLMKNRITPDQTVSIVQYAIVPFAPNAGLISWVTGADTFQQLVNDFRAHRDIKKSLENDMAIQFVGQNFNALNAVQKYEVYLDISKVTKVNELREILWLRSPTPTAWLQRNHNFTTSTALMSIAGYVIGLGDRYPSNIMIQRHTGLVIHIDFGDSFEIALNRKNYPERVPFRMTKMIINALDGSSVEGLFRKCCEDVLWTLRENQSSITAQLEVFIHEPIFSGKAIASVEKTKGILDRVILKLSGKDPFEFYGKDLNEQKFALNIPEQVDRLLHIASNSAEYIRHYVGWCPFW